MALNILVVCNSFVKITERRLLTLTIILKLHLLWSVVSYNVLYNESTASRKFTASSQLVEQVHDKWKKWSCGLMNFEKILWHTVVRRTERRALYFGEPDESFSQNVFRISFGERLYSTEIWYYPSRSARRLIWSSKCTKFVVSPLRKSRRLAW